MKSHMDSVRGLYYNAHMNVLVSGSEDATVKVWDTNKITNKSDLTDTMNQNFEPYLTIRSHTDPILCLAGTSQSTNSCMEHLVLTGSMRGSIKAFRIVGPENVDLYGA
jgi:striatin 1/3/4